LLWQLLPVQKLPEQQSSCSLLLLQEQKAEQEVSCLIDHHNNFIQITLIIDKLKIVFKDSYRIFPVSLNDFLIFYLYLVKQIVIIQNIIK
jgi:hypothetical protein